MATTKMLYFEDVEVGDETTPLYQCLTLDTVKSFQEVQSGPDARSGPSRFNDEEQAKREGLPGPIVPGNFNMALISRMLTDWSPTVQLKKLDIIFRQVVPQGTDIKIYGVVTGKDEETRELELDVYLEPMDGQPFYRGTANVGLPSRSD